MSEKVKRHYVYKITNKINGMFYIGKHSTANPNDRYMGSGILIEAAVNKYGLSAFHKEMIFEFNTEAQAYEKEAELMPELSCNQNNPMCYNLRPGGIYHTMTDDIKEKISKSVSRALSGENNPMYGEKLKDHMDPKHYEEWKTTRTGQTQCNNGIIEIFIRQGDLPPEGFVLGRLPSVVERCRRAQLGKTVKQETITKMLESKRKHGTLKRTRESIEKQMATRKNKGISPITTLGKKWFNNGEVQKFFDPDEEIPVGWHPGRLKRIKNI